MSTQILTSSSSSSSVEAETASSSGPRSCSSDDICTGRGAGAGTGAGNLKLQKDLVDYWYSNCRICFTCCSCSQFSSWQTSAKCIWARAGHCGSSRGWGHSCPGSAPHPGLPTITGAPHLRGYLVYIYWISSGVVRLWPLLSLAPFTSPLLLLWLLLLVPGPTTAHHTTATAADTGSRRYKYCTYVVSLFCTHNAGVGCDKMPSRCNVNCTIITIQSTCHIGF